MELALFFMISYWQPLACACFWQDTEPLKIIVSEILEEESSVDFIVYVYSIYIQYTQGIRNSEEKFVC